MIDFRKGTHELFGGEDEIDTNLKACIHMSAYFIPDFLKRKESSIINVSSGLAFGSLEASIKLDRRTPKRSSQLKPKVVVPMHY